eukprot:5166892-Pyramimonas_sp.AAC.1
MRFHECALRLPGPLAASRAHDQLASLHERIVLAVAGHLTGPFTPWDGAVISCNSAPFSIANRDGPAR